MPGVLITVVLSLGYALAFASYLAQAGQTYVTTYAGLASFMIALVFLYTIAATFIYRRRIQRRPDAPPQDEGALAAGGRMRRSEPKRPDPEHQGVKSGYCRQAEPTDPPETDA